MIVEVDGKKVASIRDLSRNIAHAPVGESILLTILRAGEERTVNVELAERPDTPQQRMQKSDESEDLGLQLEALTPEKAGRLGYPENEKGILVTGVRPGSKGADSGIRIGDLVKEINQRPVETLKDYLDLMGQIEEGKTLRLLIKRGDAGFLVIKITK